MVSIRCKMIVISELINLDLHCTNIELGEAEIKENISVKKYNALKAALNKSGLELINGRKAILIEKIKTSIVEMIHYGDNHPQIKPSVYLSEKINFHYTYLSNIFSETEGSTIEQFIIAHKIEYAKRLLLHNEFTIKEIACKLNYCTASHLSNQFKKVTGLTPSFFKRMKHKRLISLENLCMLSLFLYFLK